MSPGYSQNSFGHVKAFEERDIQQFLNGSNAKKVEQKRKKNPIWGKNPTSCYLGRRYIFGRTMCKIRRNRSSLKQEKLFLRNDKNLKLVGATFKSFHYSMAVKKTALSLKSASFTDLHFFLVFS